MAAKSNGAKAFFGIDLGTSQCSVAYVIQSARTDAQKVVDPTLVELSRQGVHPGTRPDTLPSVLGRDWTRSQSSRALFGVEFLATLVSNRRSAPLLRRGRDFFVSVKSDIGTHSIYPYSAIPGIRTPREATAALLKEVAELTRKANSELDPRRSPTVITVPASFSALARNETLNAARDAGFEQPELLDEPVAALLDTLNHQDSGSFLSDQFQHVLVLDFGGGTFDLALMRAKGDLQSAYGLSIETLAISPYTRLGGDDVDRSIVEDVLLLDVEGIERGTPEWRALVDTLAIAVAKPLKERLCEQLTRKPEWREQRRAPSESLPLPYKLTTTAMLPRQYQLTAADLEQVMAGFLEAPIDWSDPGDTPQSLLRPMLETIVRANLSPSALDQIVLHGGSSLNPLLRESIEGHTGERGKAFENAHVRATPSPIGSVARGAALAAYWQHARGHQLVAPILAQPLGIIVSGGGGEVLVPAGATLPFPNEHEAPDVTGESERFFVPAGGHRKIVIPYFTGYVDGAPRHAGNVDLPISEDVTAGAPIRVRVRVDQDKTLHWWFTVGGREAVEAPSVNDPWTTHVPSYEERCLEEHRRKMYEGAVTGKRIEDALLIQEANLLRLSGRLEDALLAITDFIELRGSSASAHNIRALCLGDMDRNDESINEYELAAQMAPDNPVLIGNLGCAYADSNRLNEAVATIRRALAIHSGLGYLYERLAAIARKRGDEPAAVNELRQAESAYSLQVDEDPLDRGALRDLARVRRSLGDYDGAEWAQTMLQELKHNEKFGGAADAVIWGIRAART